MIGKKNNANLTCKHLTANLYPLSQKTKVGIRTPSNIGRKRPLSPVVFLYPPKTQAVICRLLSVMAGCIEQPVKRLAGSYAGSSNLIHSATQRFEPMGGGYPLLHRITRMSQNNSAQSEQNQTQNSISIDDIIKQQDQQRGLVPLPLESELLLKRVADGGHSGQFLADAFISAYRTSTPFQHSLGELNKLDVEGFRLFHQILHIRHISGWSDSKLYQIEQQIIAIVGGGL